ncbi:MAG TPA: DinB family protein [Phycisphaerales bacterium]|nr:DinB family protein [Phycisphaerales bacterium]
MSGTTDRELLHSWWNDAWSEGLWTASWAKSLEGLTAAQAAWSPPSQSPDAGTRHSIWQIVLHMVFWREDALARLAGAPKPTQDQLARLNFPVITDTSEDAWAATRQRFADSQQRIAAALADGAANIERLRYILPHDCYHFGQINLIRAMLGFPPIE